MLIRGYVLFFGYLTLSTAPAVAADTVQLDRCIKAITRSLPLGWTLAERKSDEIPWGHHWGSNYTGPKGLLLIARGTRLVNAEFEDNNGKWRAVAVATESLEIWLMPTNYSDSHWALPSIDRPIQPTVVVKQGPIKVYARPSHLLTSERRFNELLSKSNGVRWPGSPWNSPGSLTWRDWRPELAKTIEKEFDK